jgi:hypothetical protein
MIKFRQCLWSFHSLLLPYLLTKREGQDIPTYFSSSFVKHDHLLWENCCYLKLQGQRKNLHQKLTKKDWNGMEFWLNNILQALLHYAGITEVMLNPHNDMNFVHYHNFLCKEHKVLDIQSTSVLRLQGYEGILTMSLGPLRTATLAYCTTYT